MDGDEELAKARVGQTIGGRWRLDRVLGVGGMAAVYEARDALGSVVALKLLHPEVAVKRDVRERFLREGYVANHLGHPGVVRALEHGDGGPDGVYLAMELLIGETLAARVKRHGRLPIAELVDYADQILDVLIIAHDKGVVHRDLKPDNLFVTGEGRIKILDFGLARLLDGVQSNHKTRTGLALGTLPYMAPEQALGRRNEIDGRVDLFALGATMFRILSGRRVHEAHSEAELLMAMASRPAPPLKSVAPETPDGLCSVVDLALAFSRDARYPDARTMQADLRAVRAGQAPGYASSRFSAREEATRADRPAPSIPRPAETSPTSQRATIPLSAYGGGAAHAAAPALGTTLPPGSAPALGTTLPPGSAPALGTTLPPGHAPALGTTLPPGSVTAPNSFAQAGTPYPAPASTHLAPQPATPQGYVQAPSFNSAVPTTASAPGQPAPARRRGLAPVLGVLAAVLTAGGAAGAFLLTRSSDEASAPSGNAPPGALEMTAAAAPPLPAAESERAQPPASEPGSSPALAAPAATLETAAARTALPGKTSDEEAESPAASAAALAPPAGEPPSETSSAIAATASAPAASAPPSSTPPSSSAASAPAPPAPVAPKAAPSPAKPAPQPPSKKGKPKKNKPSGF